MVTWHLDRLARSATVCLATAVVVAWPVVGSVFLPNLTWVLLAVWVSPAAAAVGLLATVLVSARAETVVEYLVLSGVEESILVFEGSPIPSGSGPERVVFLIEEIEIPEKKVQ